MFDHIDRARFAQHTVGVVYGGDSPERPVSLRTGAAIADALERAGFDVRRYDLPADLDALWHDRPAAVVLGLHGGSGEDGTIQGMLEYLKIPYTGSGVFASALAMDKSRAKAVMAARGVSVARGAYIDREDLEDDDALERALKRGGCDDLLSKPFVLKANDAGSSVGVHLLRERAQWDAALDDLRGLIDEGHAASALVEELLGGPEFSVGFFGGAPLGAIRITPAAGFYDYHAKYEANTTVYEPVTGELAERLEALASRAWRALGLGGVGRIDIMARRPDCKELVVLEANTIPGMTATSLVPKLAASLGVPFEDFCALMLSDARLARG